MPTGTSTSRSSRENNMEDTSDREITVTRTIHAPKENAFAAWTDPEHIAEWWGPNGFTTTIEHHDFRVGGFWKYMMHGPDGADYPNLMTYEAIDPPSRI